MVNPTTYLQVLPLYPFWKAHIWKTKMVIYFNNSAMSIKSSAQKFVRFALLMQMMEVFILITFVTVLLGEHALNNIAMITIQLLHF